MEAIFIQVLNMSYQASVVVGILIAVRGVLVLVKAPKKYAYYLWGIAFLRMISPVWLESIFSIMPKESKPLRNEIMYQQNPQIYTGSLRINQTLERALPTAEISASVNPMQIVMFVGSFIWLAGIFLLLLYSVVSYIRLRRQLTGCIPLEQDGKVNSYLSDYITTAFVMGIRKPSVYIPSDLSEKEMSYVLQHEKVHIRRKDYLIKPAILLTATVHWFNPLVWAAFTLAVKDMEMSCDEQVLKGAGEDIRKEYAAALLNLSMEKKYMGMLLFFGEGDVKKRIKNVMRYRKPLKVFGFCGAVGAVVLAAMLLTNPDVTRQNQRKLQNAIEHIQASEDVVYLNELVPFEWTCVYSFAPYLDTRSQEKIIGCSSSKLECSLSEDMMNLVFVNENKVAAVICGYKDTIGYDLELSEESIDWEEGYVKIQREENAVFRINKTNRTKSVIRLQRERAENSRIKEQSLRISVTEPVLDLSLGLGADGVILDYAENELVIFHGYFGLFIYSVENGGFIGAVDLEPLGCNYTQGENACEVFVSRDGGKVYLHAMNTNIMYVYDVIEKALYQEAYSMEELELFDSFEDNSVLEQDATVWRSERVVAFGEGKQRYYGYLYSGSGILEDLCYIEGDMIVKLFQAIE